MHLISVYLPFMFTLVDPQPRKKEKTNEGHTVTTTPERAYQSIQAKICQQYALYRNQTVQFIKIVKTFTQ
jgi:hypothetical protein